MSEPSGAPAFSDFGLDESRYNELKQAFNGAYSIAFLLVVIGITLGLYLPIADKVDGALLSVGLFAMCLLTSLLLMLFLSGILRMVVTVIFKRLVPAYIDVMRYDLASRRKRGE